MVDRRRLIVVLPGIGGSVLARPGRPDDVVWDAGKGDIAGVVFRPSQLRLDEAPHLEPVGLTESTKFLGFTLVPGYERLLNHLAVFGTIDRRGDPQRPVPGAAVVAVPYDFRRSIMEAAERLDDVVNAHLAGIDDADRAGVVTVVAHSMGGLVARAWMSQLARWPWCRALITLGTPHRGAPKALQWLVNGFPLLGSTRDMLRTWPSAVQLLPRYPAVWDTEAGVARYPHELPIQWLAGPAKEAYDLHVSIGEAFGNLPLRGPETVACIGWSHRTPDAGFWTDGRLRMTKDHPDWLGLHGWEHDYGDGTVPSYSALPIELDNHEHSPVRLLERHVPLAHSGVVAELLDRQRRRLPPSAAHGGERERPPAIGLNLDDVHEMNLPILVEVSIREVAADLHRQAVWARLHATGAAPVDLRLDWDDTARVFTGAFAGQSPGLYEVRVQARAVPDVGDLVASDTVGVVAGD